MVKPSALYARLVSGAVTVSSFRAFERLLRAFGFVLDRTVGSHRQYVHPRVPRPFPVQPAGRDAKHYQVRQLLELIETYGLKLDE